MSEFVKKPWGGYSIIEKTSKYWIKKLFIKKDEEFSLQSHKERSESWIVLEGKVRVQKGKKFYTLKEGEYIQIKKNEKHRIHGIVDSWVIEMAFGNPKEKDITRYEDKYGRIK